MTMTRRVCRRGRSRRARSRPLPAAGLSKARRSRPVMTTWPSPHGSLVGPRFTSPRFPTIVRRGRSRPRVGRCSAGAAMVAKSWSRRSRGTSSPIRSRPTVASRAASPRHSYTMSGQRHRTARPRAIIPASSSASVRTPRRTRARFGSCSAGRRGCARASTRESPSREPDSS